MAANDGQLNPTIYDVEMIFQSEYWKCNKNFLCWGLKMMQAVTEKYIINFVGLIVFPFMIPWCLRYDISHPDLFTQFLQSF